VTDCPPLDAAGVASTSILAGPRGALEDKPSLLPSFIPSASSSSPSPFQEYGRNLRSGTYFGDSRRYLNMYPFSFSNATTSRQGGEDPSLSFSNTARSLMAMRIRTTPGSKEKQDPHTM
jgi:hypothetical protein